MDIRFAPYEPTGLLQGHLRLGGADPAGERIELTSRYITRGGAPVIPVMGEYHFSRDDRAHWRRELAKMKAGGVTVVATYILWLYHEEEEGKLDFTGDLDVRAFVLACAEQGLDVMLRIGPWAHGECRNGGFPDWLQHSGLPLRTNDPAYMAKARGWFEQIYRQVQGLLYKDGGPVIGIQIENELTDAADHLMALKYLAKGVGLDVPIYTATGWNNQYGARMPVDEFLPVFSAYADHPWDDTVEELPLSYLYSFVPFRNDSVAWNGDDKLYDTDGWRLPYERYPFAICEMGCGLQPTHTRRPILSPMDAYALSLVKLGCGNNLIGYYMYHGGTNKIGKHSTFQESKAAAASKWDGDLPIRNYDFGTCLGQYGEVRRQYRLLNLLHLFARDFGALLAPMEPVFAEPFVPCTDAEHLRCALRTDGQAGFVFVNHHQRHLTLADVPDVHLQVPGADFPPFAVAGDICFFFPYHMPLDGERLLWATAQPVCRQGSTFFFAAVPGITPQFCFAADGGAQTTVTAEPGLESGFNFGGVRIVTLPLALAEYLRRLDGALYLGDGCDLYALDGEICAAADGDFAWWRYRDADGAFVRREAKRPFHPAALTVTAAAEPFAPRYAEELELGGPRARRWYKLAVTGPEGFVDIPGDYDAAQIYDIDGSRLLADHFYTGEVWRVPAALLYGDGSGPCWLVESERRNDFYLEPWA